MIEDVDLVIDRACLLTLDDGRGGPLAGSTQGFLGIVENGAVAVRAGRIAMIGPRESVLRSCRPADAFDAGGRAVLPGLVDAHTHPLWAGSRVAEFEQRIAGATYLQIMEAGGGIAGTVRSTRAASDAELRALLLRRLDGFLSFGTTVVEAKTGYGLAVDQELRQLRLLRQVGELHPVRLAITFLGAHAVPRDCPDAEAYVSLVADTMLPLASQECPGAFCDVFCDEGAFTLAQTDRILRAARALGMPLKVHADEFADLGCAALAARLGAVSADHLAVTAHSQMDALATAGVVAVLLPGTTFGLGSTHFADAREMIARGVPVALGTDFNPGTCPCQSLPFIAALAARYMRMSPAETVVAVTRNAAAALALDDQAGRLATGRQADLVILDTTDYRELVYGFGANPVARVMIRGVWTGRAPSGTASAA